MILLPPTPRIDFTYMTPSAVLSFAAGAGIYGEVLDWYLEQALTGPYRNQADATLSYLNFATTSHLAVQQPSNRWLPPDFKPSTTACVAGIYTPGHFAVAFTSADGLIRTYNSFPCPAYNAEPESGSGLLAAHLSGLSMVHEDPIWRPRTPVEWRYEMLPCFN
jgi:hypothetical protein